MPLTVPANVAGALVINARMVGAIAHLRGYALDDPHTRAMIPLIVVGSITQGRASEHGARSESRQPDGDGLHATR